MMIGTSWSLEDPEPHGSPLGVSHGNLVSLHFLRSEARRRWRLVAAFTVAGLLLGMTGLILMPPPARASATLLLAHDSSTDPAVASATDSSLLGTRTVSQRVVDALGLAMTAEQFRSTFTSTAASTEILEIDLNAPTSQEAVRRLAALSDAFLTFRNEQLERQATSVIDEAQQRADALAKQLDVVNQQLEAAGRAGDQNQASDLLSQRDDLGTQISALQQTIQDAQIQTAALATATHVVDSAAPVPTGGKRRIALALMSGVIGGLSLGAGLVFAQALLTNRLRRREDIATALGSRVQVSAGPVHTILPWRRRACRRNLEILADGLAASLESGSTDRQPLAVLGAGDIRAAARVLIAAADDVVAGGRTTFLVDLSMSGVLDDLVGHRHSVYRPDGRTELVRGPLALVAAAEPGFLHDDQRLAAFQSADVVLVLGEVELGVGTSQLSTWADRAVVLVAAGHVTAEYLRTTARMLHASGPELGYAMVVGSDRSDESIGLPRQAVRENQRRAQ